MTRATLALLLSMLLSGALAPAARAQVTDFEPVTTEALLAPDDGDWLYWRRTLNGQGYSPLDQIDRTAVLTTGGGLVFVGDIDRYMYAFDARDGTELWRTRTPTATDGFPITYAVDGRQYLAVPSGPGWSISWRNARIAFPETMQRPPGSGSVLQVFALPLD